MYKTIEADNLLLKLAEQIKHMNIKSKESEFKTLVILEINDGEFVSQEAKIHKWIYDILLEIVRKKPNLFEGEIVAEAEVCLGVFYIYRLDLDEFRHMFDLNGEQSIERFGGEKLTEESSGATIAKNIIELVKKRITYAIS